jgi:hypothetical protein
LVMITHKRQEEALDVSYKGLCCDDMMTVLAQLDEERKRIVIE